MLRRTPLYTAIAAEQISSGVQPDQAEARKLLWGAAQNVQFYSGKVRRRRPSSLLFNTGFQHVRGLAQQRMSNGARGLWTAVRDPALTDQFRVYVWYGAGSTHVAAINGYLDETSLREATFVDFTQLGDWTVINNGLERARLYKAPGLSQPAQFPALAVQYVKKGPFLLALGTGPRKTGVQWSDGDNWETFTPSASNLAGSLFIDDFDTGIVCGVRMGGQIAVFAEDQMGAISYIGAPYQFGQKVLMDGIGAVGKFAVASDGKNAFGVGRGGVWWTDGSSCRYIDEGYLHDYLQENVNWSQKSKIIAGRNDFRGTFEFYFPMGALTENSEGWSFDPRTGGWSPLSAATMMDERRLFTKPLLGNVAGQVFLLDDDANAAGPLTLRTKPLTLQLQEPSGVRDMHTDTRVDEVELIVKRATAVQFRYGTAGEVDGAISWTVWMDVNPAQRTYKLPHVPSGVYHFLDFQSTATNWDLDLQGFLLFGQVEGSKRGVQ